MNYDYKNAINYLILKEELDNCLTKSYLKDISYKIDNIVGYANHDSHDRLHNFNEDLTKLDLTKLDEIEKQLNYYLDRIYATFVYYKKILDEELKEKCENILPQYNITKIQLVIENVLNDIYNYYRELLNESKDKKLTEIKIKLSKFKARKFLDSSNECCVYLYTSCGSVIFSFPEKHGLAIFPNNKVLNSIVSFSITTYSINLDDQDSKDFISYLSGLGIDYKEIEIKE